MRADAGCNPAAGTGAAGAILRLSGVTKDFQGQRVLHALDLEIAEGEFMTLLGPSGCGKTTTLNIVAGFLRPDAESSTCAVSRRATCRRRSGGSAWSSRAGHCSRI